MAKSKKAKTAKPKAKAAKPKKTKVVQPKVKVETVKTKAVIPIEATKEEAKPEAKVEPKAKKPKKPESKTAFHFDPPPVKYESKAVDEGWRGYRLWTTYELDWDEKDNDTDKMKSIRKCMAKSKAALVEVLASISKDKLVIQTDLKKDDYPFEPFIEVWVARKTEDKTVEELVKIETLSMIDPEYTLEETKEAE